MWAFLLLLIRQYLQILPTDKSSEFAIIDNIGIRSRAKPLGRKGCAKSMLLKASGQKRLCQKHVAAAATAKSLQSCPTLCDPIDGSPPGSPVPGILQARVLEWGAIAFSEKHVKGQQTFCLLKTM